MAERAHPVITNSAGKPGRQSRQKAEASHKRAEEQRATADTEAWPVGDNGRPMAKITMTAAELIPTGDYANVSVGPAQITCFIDLDRVIKNGETFFTDAERQAMAQSLNELAEIVEGDVVAVQRNLVLEAMQGQIG